ncbi:unnamed protein product [Adineta steineri]|uniref:Uncharacterized protein n=1 Tax=Adineta steineri TaxID=433720 RepID=A0A813PHR4_9BILA|nr:unnamed protein product [Adineta steineri]CAF3484209.1 unnamed protein product [Adineta steineri]
MLVVFYSILVILILPVDSRKCYECSCQHDWGTNTGTCDTPAFLSSCTLNEVGNRYCFMVSTYDGNNEQRVFEALSSNNLQDSHFIQAVEKISLAGTDWLPTAISSIGYGCDWDGCNNISLIQYLPDSFQIKIDQTILNEQLIGEQVVAHNCYTCSKCINELTVTLCKQVSCPDGICFIDEVHNYMTTAENNCTFNFYSLCDSLSDSAPTPSIRIRTTYYIDFPKEKQLEIDEVDIRCIKDYCNSIQVVEYLKGQIQTTINLHPDFTPNRPNGTATTTATISSSTSTTTTPGSKSTRSYPIGILYLIFTLLLL